MLDDLNKVYFSHLNGHISRFKESEEYLDSKIELLEQNLQKKSPSNPDNSYSKLDDIHLAILLGPLYREKTHYEMANVPDETSFFSYIQHQETFKNPIFPRKLLLTALGLIAGFILSVMISIFYYFKKEHSF